MPHQCTSCGHTFADGSKEMLGGCPECGGAKFQFRADEEEITDDPPDDQPSEPDSGGVAETVGRATATVRDWIDEDPSASSGDSDGSDDMIAADERPPAGDDDPGEDHAQASARSDVASPEELPDPPDDPADGRIVSEPADERPEMSQLREELNDQFESIRIVEPGQYELNLMELYDREEYIIALQENGRYVIQMPENWIGDGE